MDVDFKYPTGPTILKNVNFGLDQSSRVCIVGPNGAGACRGRGRCRCRSLLQQYKEAFFFLLSSLLLLLSLSLPLASSPRSQNPVSPG